MVNPASLQTSGPGPAFDSAGWRYCWEAAPVLACVLDPQGRVLRQNRLLEQILGPVRPEAAFTSWLWDPHQVFSLPEALAAPEREWMLDLNTPGGLPQTYHFRFFPAGEEILALGRENAAETSRLRGEIIALNTELANRARELLQDKAQLERLNQLKNQFLGMAAHDLRKPIHAILSLAELLQDELAGTLSAEHAGWLGRLRQAGGHMKQIVDDFLDLAVIESGRLRIAVQTARLAEVVEQAGGLVEPLLRRRQVRLAVAADPALPAVPLDASKIEQVLANLIGNAAEHSPPGGVVRVEAWTRREEVVVCVRDQGPGLDGADLARMFEPFQRGRAAKGGRINAGLGLAISRKIILEHGGRIWAESEPGRGTAFHFSLPVRVPPTPLSRNPAP
jgi:signal transduction histidine kinase